MSSERLTDGDYQELLRFRDGLRSFLRWSSDQAKAVGLTAGQHQLLLVLRGHHDPQGPTMGDVAAHLLVRHHSAVELVDRCERSGLVVRRADVDDQRAVRVRLTAKGEEHLERLSELHLAELGRLAPRLAPIWADLGSPSAE